MILKVFKGKIIEGPQTSLKSFNYAKEKKILGHLILPITRWLRAHHAEKYMLPAEKHLDIGCGDGYFLKRSNCKEGYGIDKFLGSEVTNILPFRDNTFDYVTMLAVIEHLHSVEPLIKEISRVLKSKGKLIITTPKRAADTLIKIYVNDIDEEHVGYYSLEDIKNFTKDFFNIVGHHTFIFGLNQIFCLEKLTHS